MMRSDLDARTEAAIARLETSSDFRLRCPSCGHEDRVPQDPSRRLYTCDECGGRTACGVEMPRVYITPHPADRRFIVLRFASGKPKQGGLYEHDVSMPLERQYATGLALDLLSGGDPGLFQEFLAFLALRQIDAASSSPSGPPDGVSLDVTTIG
jgi:predicted RNA-binding Zn-ribbon protein involved in translation (DUF1610 family)